MRIAAVAAIFALGTGALDHALSVAADRADGPSAVTFHVATGGRDAWSGRLPEANEDGTDGPFASVGRAQRAVRDLRRGGEPPEAITIRVRGMHRLTRPIVLRPEDSGTAKCPVSYAAYPGERPVLSGGRRITGWQKDDGSFWSVELPQVKAGKWYFRQLFVNGRRTTRARSPNDGYFRVQSLVDEPPGKKWNVGVDKFRFRPGDIRPWKDLHNVEIMVFHSWNTSRVRIASVDEQKQVVVFTDPTIFRPLAWDPLQRYYVENAVELLDAPGEWYLDRRSGRLTYWPLPGEDMTIAEVIAPVLGELLRFEGDADAGKFVDHVHVTGLSFQHADWTLAETGYGDPQAAVTIPAAVMADGARHCTFEKCEIARVGTYGIWFRRGCKDNRIVQNHIHGLGAGGVRIGEAKMAKTDVAESSRNLISNNYIHNGGHVYPAGVGFWLAHGSDNTFSHNEIHGLNYSGISLGWNWSDVPTRTLRNVIERNHVHHVVRGVLSDAGGIYMLGTQTGTVIRNNIFHDIWPYMGKPAMAWGIYFDAGSNGLLVENNIVYNTLTGGIMNTGNHGNVIRNNIFANSAWHAVWRSAWKKEPASVFERNIIYLTQGELFHNDAGRTDFQSKWDYNLYWRTDGKPLLFYDEDFQDWQSKGMDRHGLVADPLFVDAAAYDFRLRPDSPALKLGFKPIDTSKVGLRGSADWVALPKQVKFLRTELPPAPPPPKPVPVNDGFEQTALGEPPALATVCVEGRDGLLHVTDETAAAGKRCLKFQDAPGMQHVFNPHMFYTPHFHEGRATLTFDLRLEKDAVVVHEWRDGAHPYRVGPSIRINPDGKLLAGGKHLTDVPIGEWFRVEIVCNLGSHADGKYDLKVTLPGETPKTYPSLACGSGKFKSLRWLGFVSLAVGKTVFYLDNVALGLLHSHED